jgi:hypothetical protein
VLIKKIRVAQNEYKKITKHFKSSYLREYLTRLYIKRAPALPTRGGSAPTFLMKPEGFALPPAARLSSATELSGFRACAQKLPNHIFKNIDLSYLFYLYGSQSEGIQQKLTNKFKWNSRSLKQYKYFWSLITKFQNNLITSEAPGQNFITKAHEDLKKIKLGLRRAGITQSKKSTKNLKDYLKTLASSALVRKQTNLSAKNWLALAWEIYGILPMLKSSKLFYKGFQEDIALFEDKSNQITRWEYLKKKDLLREQKDLKQIFQAKKELLKDLISNLRLFRKLKLNFHLNKSKFEEKLLYRLKNLIIQYYNKKVEFNFVNLKSLIFNSDLFTYILTLKLKKEKGKPRIIRLMKFILNKAKMPEIRLNRLHKNWESELAPGGKNIKLRLLNNNKSLETKLSLILGRNHLEGGLSKLLNMLYFNASAIYGGEAPLPQPLANEINSLGMQSMSSLLRAGEAHIKSMRNVVRTSSARFASEFITASEAANYLIRISWANYKRTWSKTSAYALNYFIFNSINYKNMGGVRLEVSGRLSKRYRADRAIYKLLWKGGLKNIDSSVQGKSSVVFRGFRDSNVQYSWFKSKRRIGSFAVKGWSGARYSTMAINRKDLTTSSSSEARFVSTLRVAHKTAATSLAGCLNPWVVPLVKYANADIEKPQIINENKGKSGVYRWINILNENTYIGSSTNLAERFRQYFSYNYISDKKRGKSIISHSLLKYGYASFSVEILEYCDRSEVLSREQYYLDLLKPEYNTPSG